MPKIIIIGGGISGLTAGIYARNAGFEAEIYESNTVAGGLCSGWKRNGYLVAGGVHWLTGIKENTELRKMWEGIGAIDSTTEFFSQDVIATCKNEGTYHHLYTDLTKLEEEFLSISPEDAAATKELIRAIKIHQKLPVPVEKPEDLMEEMEKLIFFAPYLKAEKAFPIAGVSIADYASRFRSSIIRDLLLCVVPNTNLSVRTLLKWLAINSAGDAGFPSSGFGAMAQRMKNKFEKSSGKLFFDSKVRRINVINGVATGITLENGTALSADYVISTASPDVLLRELLDSHYEDAYFEKRFNASADYPTLAMTLIPLIIDADMSKFPYKLYFTPKQAVVVNKTEIKRLKINHYGYDYAFCRNGKTLAEVFLHTSEYDYWHDLKASSPQTYKEVKEKIAEHVIAEVETVYPETQGKIKLLDVATPVTFQHYTGNFRGSYVPFCTMPDIEYENHPGVITGVKNLYLAGQWVFPDGGLPMAALGGKYAVQRICNQENRNNHLQAE
jgi:phytoene dehydrogenase-like protein